MTQLYIQFPFNFTIKKPFSFKDVIDNNKKWKILIAKCGIKWFNNMIPCYGTIHN